MKISANIGMQNNSFNAARINQTVAMRNESSVNQQEQQKKDKVSISMFGRTVGQGLGKQKKQSMLESLMEQRQNLIDSKNEFMAQAKENGSSSESMKARLDSFKEQMESLDEQIAQATKDMAAEDVEQKEDNKKPKTKEEAEAERLNSITELATNVEQAEHVWSVKTRVDGQADVLRSEIKQDGSRVRSQKLEQLVELEQQAVELQGQVYEKIGEVNRNVVAMNDAPMDSEDPNKETSMSSVIGAPQSVIVEEDI